MNGKKTATAIALLLASITLLSSCTLPSPTVAAVTGGEVAVEILGSLPVKGPAPKTGYARAKFGPAWEDTDHNGCDTRDDILRRDLKHTTNRGCKVTSGTLDDPYTGREIVFTRVPRDAGH